MQVSQKEDLHERITKQIIVAIEKGAGTYQMPWNPKLCGNTSPIGLPHNPVGQYSYNGINILSLWASQQDKNYLTPEWATFKQWRSVGAQVRKGEKGTLTVFFKSINADSGLSDTDIEKPHRHFIAKAAYVFNMEQVDGYELPAPPDLLAIDRNIAADEFIQSSGAIIYNNSRSACYVPSQDEIHLPPEGAFIDAPSYYSVALHELVHWTGHADRCARDLHSRFGSEAYAAEELIAELGAAFLCAEIGISPEPRIDHARYIDSWLEILKNDKRAVFTAAAKANQATTFLTALTKKTRINNLSV